MVEFEFGLVQIFLLCLEDDLKKNVIADAWMENNLKFFVNFKGRLPQMKIIKVTLNNRESSGSAIQLSSRTCLCLNFG